MIPIIVPIIFGLANVVLMTIVGRHKKVDYRWMATIIGGVVGVVFSLIGRFILELPSRLYKMEETKEWIVHPVAAVLYAAIFLLIVAPLTVAIIYPGTKYMGVLKGLDGVEEALVWVSQPLAIAGAVAVVLGVVIANSYEQATSDKSMTSLTHYLSTTLFLIGWGLTITANLSHRKTTHKKKALVSVGGIMVAFSAIFAKSAMNNKTSLMLPMVGFLGGWIMFSLGASYNVDSNKINRVKSGLSWGGFALIAAGMGILTMYQRDACIVDGPGMVLFTLGWVFVAANAATLHK